MPEEKTLPVFEEIDQQLGASKATAPPDQGQETQLSRAIVNVLPALDPAVIKLQDEVEKLLRYSLERAVASIEGAKSATNDLSIMLGLKKALKEKRKEYLQPLEEYKESIRGVFDSISGPLEQAYKVTGDKVIAFKQEQTRLRLEAENAARLQREADAAARRVLEETGEVIEGPQEAPVIVPDVVSKQVHADLGTSGVTTNWKWEVTDFALLPDGYKVVDGPLLTAIARKHHDQKPVPGVRFYKEEGLRVTAKGGE